MSKGLKIFLTLSLVLNVLLLGLSGGMAYKRFHRESWPAVKESLSPEARNLMAREFQVAHEQMRENGKKARAARKEIIDALSAENFDEGQFDAAVQDLRKAQRSIMSAKIEATKRLVTELSQEERKKLAGHFASSFGGRPPGSWHKNKSADGKHDFPKPQEND